VFDSHCHLTDDKLAPDVDDVIARARAAGVNGLVTVASDLDDAVAAAALATSYTDVWCTAGVPPHAAGRAPADWEARLRQLLAHPRCVAVGEAGLDYYYDNAPRAVQRAVFERQLELAAEHDLPIIVHAREAEEDTAAMVRAAQGTRGVLHCFDAGTLLLDAALDADWFVSFAGLITFKRYTGGALVARVPADRLLAETDSPYLAPVPHRGKRNEPAFVAQVCDALAQYRGEPAAAVRASTEANARTFYRIAA
jgi:TatD DNase family protein